MANTLKFKRGLVGTIPTAALGEPLFTTDTFDLYIGNGTGNTRFQKYIASGTTSQLLRGDGSLLTMPIVLSSPANGEVLKYNGTNWVNSSDAGITGSGVAGQVAYFTGATTQGGSNNLFWDASNNRLGIGTNTPGYSLHVKSGNITTLKLDNDNSRYVQLLFERNTVANTGADFLLDGTNGTFSIRTLATFPLIFSTAVTTGNSVERMRLTTSGNVIINNPSSDNGLRFQVTGDGYFSGSVGIARTPSASYKLHVAGDVAYEVTSGNVGFSLISGADSYSFYFNDADNSYRIYSSNGATDRLVLSSTGNLGLGVTPSAWGTRAIEVGYLGNGVSGNGDTWFTNNTYRTSGGTWTYARSAASALYSQSGSHAWLIAPSGTAGNTITWTQAMTLTASGNLLVGTSTDVTGKVQVVGAGGIRVNEDGSGTKVLSIRSDFAGVDPAINVVTSNSLLLMTANTERARIDASGNLGLGVTPSAWRSNEKVLQLGTYTALWNIAFVTALGNNTYTNSSGTPIYLNNDLSSRYLQQNGKHVWETAPSGTAGNAITFTQAMTLDASGNLGVGTTAPKARLHTLINGNASIGITGTTLIGQNSSSGNSSYLTLVGAFDADAGIVFTDESVGYRGRIVYSNNNEFMSFWTDLSERMRIHATGNLSLGSTSDAGFKLDVNGTMRVSGASTFGGNLTIGDTTTGRNVNVYSSSYGNNGVFQAFGTDGLLKLQMGGLGTTTAFLYTGAGNQMQLFSGNAVALTLASNQAATFSSSVTAASLNVNGSGTFSNTSNGLTLYGAAPSEYKIGFDSVGATVGYIRHNIISQNPNNAWGHIFSTSRLGTPNTFVDVLFIGASANVGIGTNTPSYKLDVTGSARISDAIAIGTTPDTNLPFKILKNINSTVGIRFENTSTGASAFSAVQFGQDVTGGTAFANMVYANSAITESGVYKPSGTAIINTGSGGLNFLAVSQPIRFFTSTGNGTLRAEIANDGFINHYTGTAPSTNLTDGYRQYSADITAGNAAPHFRTENGGIIKLYQQTTGVTSATYIGGAGTGLTDSDTFDGYTIAQIVKALRNAGLLA